MTEAKQETTTIKDGDNSLFVLKRDECKWGKKLLFPLVLHKMVWSFVIVRDIALWVARLRATLRAALWDAGYGLHCRLQLIDKAQQDAF